MTLTGIHLLLTCQCNYECDHCFVWGSPRQEATMTLARVRAILAQARELGTVEWIYFEGGEPFLFYTALLVGVREAARLGFRVGIVSNAYWATSEEDARECLAPFAGLVQDFSVSCDTFHGNDRAGGAPAHAEAAARALGIPVGVIRVARPEAPGVAPASGQLPIGQSAVMFRGRAAEKLAAEAPQRPWDTFTECPHEDLREPGRVHVDPLGNVHVCQGISAGNLFRDSLRRICGAYDADAHPVVGPLLRGGPAELVRSHGLAHGDGYADACHLCDAARRALRPRFPDALTPDALYGVFGEA
ncbi:MAG TPA: radical SAM protein [Candidatus Saccharimonadales bacterium]|nr:radical SAM protein [Candidatus Saccharimonadales bacterium]